MRETWAGRNEGSTTGATGTSQGGDTSETGGAECVGNFHDHTGGLGVGTAAIPSCLLRAPSRALLSCEHSVKLSELNLKGNTRTDRGEAMERPRESTSREGTGAEGRSLGGRGVERWGRHEGDITNGKHVSSLKHIPKVSAQIKERHRGCTGRRG